MLFSVDDISFDVKAYCERLLIDITNTKACNKLFFLYDPILLTLTGMKLFFGYFSNMILSRRELLDLR